ncbi:UNVERIFIED_CONTAM: Protein hgh1 [Gekko kuhli]
MAAAESSVPGGGGGACLEELLPFLGAERRPELRREAARGLLGLTGGAEGRRLLGGRADVAAALLASAGDPCAEVAGDALRALVNLAAEPAARPALAPALPALLRRALDSPGGDPLADLACAALANLARDPASCRLLWRALRRRDDGGLAPLVDKALCPPRGSGAPAPRHSLGPLLANLSQLPEARHALLDPARQRLLPCTQDTGSSLLRGGVVGTLRNCCFDYGRHEWLLSDQVDLLPFLLLPLAGPEEFPEDEMEKLPVDLQYLPPEKQREPDPDIRKMLLEALLLLTATKPGRLLVRERGTYFILRELHKWEADPGSPGGL